MPVRREGQGFHRQPLPRLRPAMHDVIGRRLRLHYEDLQQQPLPGRLAELMRQLEGLPEDTAPPRRGCFSSRPSRAPLSPAISWCRGIAGIVLAVPILVTFRVICAHVEALAPFGEFLAQRHGPDSP